MTPLLIKQAKSEFSPTALLLKAALVEENVKYHDRVNQDAIQAALTITKKLVIVGQTPKAGGDVPLGTVVNLVLAVKEDLPLASLGAMAAVASKFQNAAAVESAVESAASAAVLKNILTAQPDYTKLKESDKTVVDGFLTQHGLQNLDKAVVYSDLQFAFVL